MKQRQENYDARIWTSNIQQYASMFNSTDLEPRQPLEHLIKL